MSEETKNLEMEIAEEFIGMVSAVSDSMDRIYQAHKEEFEKTFGQPLRLYWRWHGFDLDTFVTSFALHVKFMSIRDVVEFRFGKHAADLIESLIGYAMNQLTPRSLETICRCNTMACWWPNPINTLTEPAWLCIADELREIITRPGDDDLKIKLQQAFRYALLQHLTQDKTISTFAKAS